MSINKAELLKMGARSRLVEIETERFELLRLFPDLDHAEQVVSMSGVARKPKRTKKAGSKLVVKKTARKTVAPKTGKRESKNLETVAALAESHDTITSADVLKKLDISSDHAGTLLSYATKRGMLERVERGVYRKAGAR